MKYFLSAPQPRAGSSHTASFNIIFKYLYVFPMFLFINKMRYAEYNDYTTKYISCSYLSEMCLEVENQVVNLNTSHVLIYPGWIFNVLLLHSI